MKYSGIFNAHVDNIYCLAVMNVNTVLLLACIHWQAETVLEYSWYVHLLVHALIIFHLSFLNGYLFKINTNMWIIILHVYRLHVLKSIDNKHNIIFIQVFPWFQMVYRMILNRLVLFLLVTLHLGWGMLFTL